MRPSRSSRFRVVLLTIALTSAVGANARAFEEFTPTEALGTGGASRAWAVGDEGPLLNPSGMSLTKAYTIDGTYGYASRLSHGVIGKGMNDYDKIFSTLCSVGFNSWVSIEDGLGGMDELRESVRFLGTKIDQHFGD